MSRIVDASDNHSGSIKYKVFRQTVVPLENHKDGTSSLIEFIIGENRFLHKKKQQKNKKKPVTPCSEYHSREVIK